MNIVSQREFSSLINEVFGSVFQEYAFALSEEGDDLNIAKKDNVEVIFRLEYSYHTCHFSLEIRLSGQLGEKATSEAKYRHLGVIAIAKCVDPHYTRWIGGAGNLAELRQIAEDDKEALLRYCRDILEGDVSSWQKVVDCLHEKARSGSGKPNIPNRGNICK